MNTINRYNYENYFLLWMDGELPQTQVEEMEEFIANNPDLASELALLQETKLPIDETIVYSNKERLLKHDKGDISILNYESFFLLYVDNELPPTQKEAVELFVLQHPALQEAFLLLQQTKLPAEKLVFRNKEILYRKEEKLTPVIFMRFSRVAVAAAIFGLVAMLWILIPQNNLKKSVTFSAANRTISKQADNKNAATSIIGSEKTQQKNKIESFVAQQQNTKQTIQYSAGSAKENKQVYEEVKKEALTALVDTDKSLNNSTNSTNNSVENILQQNNTVRVHEEEAQNKVNTVQKQAIEEEEQAQPSRPEVYKELDTDEDKSLYIGALELNKDKVRGFFRKAGNVFRSKNKTEEDGRNRK